MQIDAEIAVIVFIIIIAVLLFTRDVVLTATIVAICTSFLVLTDKLTDIAHQARVAGEKFVSVNDEPVDLIPANLAADVNLSGDYVPELPYSAEYQKAQKINTDLLAETALMQGRAPPINIDDRALFEARERNRYKRVMDGIKARTTDYGEALWKPILDDNDAAQPWWHAGPHDTAVEFTPPDDE